jgi:transposase-like protein
MNTTTAENKTDETRVSSHRRPATGERERVVAEWASSGKTVDEMAAATGWSPYTLYRWRLDAGQGKRSKPKVATEPRLLVVAKPAAAGVWAAEVVIGAGVSLRLSAGCPSGWAAELVRELRRCLA